MRSIKALLLCWLLLCQAAHADKITLAAASDLKFAMDEIITAFRKHNAGDDVDIVYGSSGKFFTQIQQGAPYDLFFSADIDYPRQLADKSLAASPVVPYAIGRIVLWSPSQEAPQLTSTYLNDSRVAHIAIANPQHAPYGKRAEEALRALKLWDSLQKKLVFGENIAQTAQFVQSGNAQVGVLALSLALSPELVHRGSYYLIPDTLHEPLEQGFVILQRAKGSELAKRFADYMSAPAAREIMRNYGFSLPAEAAVH